MNKWILGGIVAIPLSIVGGILLLTGILLFMATAAADEEKGLQPMIGSEISAEGQQEIPPEYLPIYKAAGQKYGIPWNLIAAIHKVETQFSGIDLMVSGVGAEGHMQFMPCTWVGWGHPSCSGLGAGAIPVTDKINPAVIAKYGGYGTDGNRDGKADPWDITDAVYTTAKYLSESGAKSGDYEKAIFTYNHSEKYVADVLMYMKRYAAAGAPVQLTPGTGGFSRPIQGAYVSQFGMRFHPVDKVWR